MPRQTLDDPTLVFLRAVWSLDHGLQTHSKRMKATSGVTGPQRLVLRVLQLVPETAPTDLARILVFHKSTVTIILRGLEKANLIRRATNPVDRRAVILTLTPKGRRIAEQRTGTVEAVFRKVLARMAASNVEIAQNVIEELARAFA